MIVLMNFRLSIVLVNFRLWFVKFRSGDFSLEDEFRSGRLTGIKYDNLRTLVETDPLQTVRGTAEKLDVSYHAVFDGLKRIEKVKKLEKLESCI